MTQSVCVFICVLAVRACVYLCVCLCVVLCFWLYVFVSVLRLGLCRVSISVLLSWCAHMYNCQWSIKRVTECTICCTICFTVLQLRALRATCQHTGAIPLGQPRSLESAALKACQGGAEDPGLRVSLYRPQEQKQEQERERERVWNWEPELKSRRWALNGLCLVPMIRFRIHVEACMCRCVWEGVCGRVCV